MNKKHYKSAFSLIELSIVILVIGILISGVVQGSKLYDKFKLQTARSLTQSSPVHSIKDLALWYETSMENSFIASEAVEGGRVSIWYNINKQKNSFPNASVTLKNTSEDCSTSRSPFYKENVLNGLPSLNFQGGECINFDGSVLHNTDFTIIIVAKLKQDFTSWSWFIGGYSASPAYNNISIGWRAGTNLFFFWDYQGTEAAGPTLLRVGSNTKYSPTLSTSWYNQNVGKKLWLNGGVTPGDQYLQPSLIPKINNYAGSAIGRWLGVYSNMDMFELIIFQRALTNEERMSVEKYLSQKYAIKIKS